jgi:hypothetical protein
MARKPPVSPTDSPLMLTLQRGDAESQIDARIARGN